MMEQYYTDKEFCAAFKITRSTSAEWRDQGIVSYSKLPNGQIRYSESDIEALKRFRKEASTALDDSNRPIKRSVVDIGVAKGRRNVGVAQNA